MGRPALSTKEREAKAARERERAKRNRQRGRENNQGHPIQQPANGSSIHLIDNRATLHPVSLGESSTHPSQIVSSPLVPRPPI